MNYLINLPYITQPIPCVWFSTPEQGFRRLTRKQGISVTENNGTIHCWYGTDKRWHGECKSGENTRSFIYPTKEDLIEWLTESLKIIQ